MSNQLLHSTLTILQHCIATDASAKEKVLQMLNALPVQKTVRATAKNIGAADLLKKKYWSNQDRQQAMQLVKLPKEIQQFFTQKNMV